MKMPDMQTEINCPICGYVITIPLTVTRSPVRPIDEMRFEIDVDYTALREHVATHLPGPGDGLPVAI
jgi:hypothetical protein